MIKRFLFASTLVLSACFGPQLARAADAPDKSLCLWYARPAEKWTEALPVGNGRMGAMVFGGVFDERIQFNEDTLWKGFPHDYDRAGAHDHLAEIRQLLFDGKTKEAIDLTRTTFLSDPVRQKAYQPFGDLHLHFVGQGNASDYRRELDLDSATATTTYRRFSPASYFIPMASFRRSGARETTKCSKSGPMTAVLPGEK